MTHSATPKPRALLVCEAANPEWTSVPLEGWSHARAIAAQIDTHTVTQVRNAPAFRRAGLSDADFTAIDTEAIARGLYRFGEMLRAGPDLGWTIWQSLEPISYRYFEHLLWRQFADRITRGEFDIVHRLTPLSPTVPSTLAHRCARADIPFILGPLNGGIPWPRAFAEQRRREGEWMSHLRPAYRLVPGYRSTRRHAAAIICGSLRTLHDMPSWCRDRCIYIPENAVDPARFGQAPLLIDSRAPSPPLRIAFVGRLVPYKGADMLLEAAAPLIRAGEATVDIIGNGPEMPRLQSIVRREHLQDGVTLHGHIPHTDLQQHLGAAHIFAFPSIREFGGAVVLEAMALGVVPVVVHYGGPGELVTPDTGFRIPLGTRAELIERFGHRLAELAREARTPAGAADLAAFAQRARARVMQHFTWEAKARQVLEVYRWVRGQRDKPDFAEILGPPAPRALRTPQPAGAY